MKLARSTYYYRTRRGAGRNWRLVNLPRSDERFCQLPSLSVRPVRHSTSDTLFDQYGP